MKYYYKVFGLTCSSEIELPAFVKAKPTKNIDFTVSLGKASINLFENDLFIDKPFIKYNDNEFFMYKENIGRYFVKNSKEVIIEPLCNEMNSVLLFFNSNSIAAILYQKNIIPFHVSGVFDNDGKVWLFGALSGTGKSTTSVKLKELGYKIFTDDTARIYVENGKCYAIASYPMTRLWENSLHIQKGYDIEKAELISDEHQKYGLLFHDDFISEPVEVKGIVFLEKTASTEIKTATISAIEGMKLLANNIYRRPWSFKMNKKMIVHKNITQIAQKVRFYKAERPENKDTFNEFAQSIMKDIIEK